MTDETRRRFLGYFSGLGFGGTLLPGVLWAQLQQQGSQAITAPMLRDALALSGLDFSEQDQNAMLQATNQNLARIKDVRNVHIPDDVAPPFYFSPIVPGMTVNRTRRPFHFSAPRVRRPARLEDVAFWPVTRLSQLIRTKQVTSVELTGMYLERLHRYNERLNCVVTFLDDVALAQARQADAEIKAGKYRGPLHGVPWGAKDIIAVKGYRTTWGSGAYRDQVIDKDASVVGMLREAGAVLLAKLASGELAAGDRWFGGQTRNPWNPSEGSSGSSAGPGSATAAGLVGFSIGSETSGSILSPSARCGVTGLRPTFGRVSRSGVMALSWTQDRLGPLCRYSEDCAMVMSVIARPDGQDMSVSDIPFNWDSRLNVNKLRVGYLKDGFADTRDPIAQRNAEAVLAHMSDLGVRLIPLSVPDAPVDAGGFNVESAVFFDELVRSGRDKEMTDPARANSFRSSRLIPAVEYLQAQRVRMLMMMKLSEATADVDVYVVPANPGGAAGRGPSSLPPPPSADPARRSATQRHFNMANTAGYPAISVPNGFTDAGAPTAITFYARPFGETELLTLTRAWQDASGFHLKHPTLDTPSRDPESGA